MKRLRRVTSIVCLTLSIIITIVPVCQAVPSFQSIYLEEPDTKNILRMHKIFVSPNFAADHTVYAIGANDKNQYVSFSNEPPFIEITHACTVNKDYLYCSTDGGKHFEIVHYDAGLPLQGRLSPVLLNDLFFLEGGGLLLTGTMDFISKDGKKWDVQRIPEYRDTGFDYWLFENNRPQYKRVSYPPDIPTILLAPISADKFRVPEPNLLYGRKVGSNLFCLWRNTLFMMPDGGTKWSKPLLTDVIYWTPLSDSVVVAAKTDYWSVRLDVYGKVKSLPVSTAWKDPEPPARVVSTELSGVKVYTTTRYEQLERGLPTMIVVPKGKDSMMYTECAEKVLITRDGGLNWDSNPKKLVYEGTKEAARVKEVLAADGSGLILALSWEGDIMVSEDDGTTWKIVQRQIPVQYVASGVSGGNMTLFVLNERGGWRLDYPIPVKKTALSAVAPQKTSAGSKSAPATAAGVKK